MEEHELSAVEIALALSIPVAALLAMIFTTWSVLMKAYDLSHVPLFVMTLLPLVAAVAVPVFAGATEPIDLHTNRDLTILVTVIALVALAAIVEVIGHEVIGYRHTWSALQRDGSLQPGDAEQGERKPRRN